MARHRKPPPPPPPEKDESEIRWLISYSDFMMQLVCLFILLYSVSNVDKKKAAVAEAGYRAHVGLPPAIPGPQPPGLRASLDSISLIGGELGQGDVPERMRYRVREVPGGRQIEFPDSLFATGSAELSPGARAAVDDAVRFLRSYVGRVAVTGYVSDDPADAPDGDGLKMAQARSESVVVHMTRPGFKHAMDPRFVVAQGSFEASEKGHQLTILLRKR